VGAHVIGYQASMLAQQLVQGMHLGSTVDEMAEGQVWIHPALNEVNEVALLKLMEAFDACTP
jgi:mycothione reductase